MGNVESRAMTLLRNRVFLPEDQRNGAAAATASAAEAELAAPLAVLDPALADRDYLLGDRFTVADLNVAAVMALALAPPAPTGVVLDIRQLSHDTRVAWDDPGDMRTVGYRVRMRPTWAPEWSERVDLGRVFEHTFKGISKDDVVFAVEAYDVDGNTSIPVYPTPRR